MSITKAKVSNADVNAFRDATLEVLNYMNPLEQRLQSLNDLSTYISQRILQVTESISILQKTQKYIIQKIDEIERVIEQLIKQRDEAESQLDAVEARLASTPSEISSTDSDGNKHTRTNPEYIRLCQSAASFRQKIAEFSSEIYKQQNRLNHARSISQQAAEQENNLNNILNRLETHKQETDNVRIRMDEIITASKHRCIHSDELLQKISRLVQNYMDSKMKFEKYLSYNNDDTLCQSNCQFSQYSMESKYMNCSCSTNENANNDKRLYIPI